MQSIEDKIYYFITGHKRGWVFTAADITKNFPRHNVDLSLSRLAKRGTIRRITRGLYDYPKYSELLKKYLSPEFDQVARVYARKSNWKIIPTGDAALNLLGLSTQIPGRYVYLSSGTTKKYEIKGYFTIEFKRTPPNEVSFIHKESGVVIQALKAIGENHINDKVLNAKKKYLGDTKCKQVLEETNSTTSWIYESIKKACRSGNE